jgi:integrase
MPLTDIVIRAAQPKNRTYRLPDADKLYLEINPSGSKIWRVRIKSAGKETMLSLGPYPAVTLKEARARRDEMNVQAARGIDPAEARRKAAAERRSAATFKSVYEEWLERSRGPWTPGHYIRTQGRAQSHLLPYIGHRLLQDIAPPDVLAALRKLEARGKNDTAHAVMSICSRVFRYAIASGYATSDPCRDLRGALAPVVVTHNAALTDPKAGGKLLLDIENYTGGVVVLNALRLAPLVFVRPGELRRAEWDRIDEKDALWRIPAPDMKMRELHLVPLSRQALEIIRYLRSVTGGGRYLFPSIRSRAMPMSDMTVTAALRTMGYPRDVMTGHGFRTTASTLLNEQGWRPDLIEKQLAHEERNKVRAAYNRAQYLAERREMMQAWADYLDKLREEARAAMRK